MKKRMIRIAAALTAVAILVPVCREMDDGGSREYSAVLYRVALRRSMARKDGVSGYLSGTEIRILGIEGYSDVIFVPSGGK